MHRKNIPSKGPGANEAEILADLMHDIRTPLTALLGAAELLGSGRLGEVPDRVSGLLKVAASAAGQIRDILDEAARRAGTDGTQGSQ
jgi:signal transduction histidine kinase